jgi:RNA polymerase sigma-70 factor (ECF subfamily)
LDTGATATDSVEVALVRRARDGDADAFADLVRSYQRRVVSVAYRLLGDADDAADVSQDAFIRAYRHLSQLEDPSRLGPWLMRIATNLALNFRRARKTRSAASLDNGLTSWSTARSPDGERRLTVGLEDDGGPLPAELQVAISDAMEQLPDKQRLALILFSVEGMPQKEVAEVMDCSVELVKWNVFQARRKLKEMLAEFL